MVYHMALRHMGVGTRKRLGDHSSPEKPTHAAGSRTCALATTRLYVCVCVCVRVHHWNGTRGPGEREDPYEKSAAPNTASNNTHSDREPLSQPCRLPHALPRTRTTRTSWLSSTSCRGPSALSFSELTQSSTGVPSGSQVRRSFCFTAYHKTCWHVPASFAASPCTQDLFPRFFSLWASS